MTAALSSALPSPLRLLPLPHSLPWSPPPLATTTSGTSNTFFLLLSLFSPSSSSSFYFFSCNYYYNFYDFSRCPPLLSFRFPPSFQPPFPLLTSTTNNICLVLLLLLLFHFLLLLPLQLLFLLLLAFLPGGHQLHLTFKAGETQTSDPI